MGQILDNFFARFTNETTSKTVWKCGVRDEMGVTGDMRERGWDVWDVGGGVLHGYDEGLASSHDSASEAEGTHQTHPPGQSRGRAGSGA